MKARRTGRGGEEEDRRLARPVIATEKVQGKVGLGGDPLTIGKEGVGIKVKGGGDKAMGSSMGAVGTDDGKVTRCGCRS